MNTWTNLLSGFLGAIVGGLITLLATWITIRQERRQFADARSQGAARELMTLALGPLRDFLSGRDNPLLPGLGYSMRLTLIPLIADHALRRRLTSLVDFLGDLEKLKSRDGIRENYIEAVIEHAVDYLAYVTESLSAYLADLALPPQQEPSRHLLTVLENLDNGDLSDRLTSIRALEDIANELNGWESVEYFLTRFVGRRAPWPPKFPDQPPLDESIESISLNSWAPDVQLALSVLGRRKQSSKGYYRQLYLDRNDLRGADLKDTKLRDVWLKLSNLRGADFGGADLSEAKFEDADLQGAIANPTTVWPSNFEPGNHGIIVKAE